MSNEQPQQVFEVIDRFTVYRRVTFAASSVDEAKRIQASIHPDSDGWASSNQYNDSVLRGAPANTPATWTPGMDDEKNEPKKPALASVPKAPE